MKRILNYFLIIFLMILYIPLGLYAIVTFYLSKLGVKGTDYLQNLINKLNNKQ